MTPGRVNFVCPQGSTFNRVLTYKIGTNPVNLAGYSADMQIRERAYSKQYIAYLNTGNGGINLGASAGTISLNIAASTTSNFIAGDYVFDLELTSTNGSVTRLIEGKFNVTPEVTRIG
jgi:hypothetical protein